MIFFFRIIVPNKLTTRLSKNFNIIFNCYYYYFDEGWGVIQKSIVVLLATNLAIPFVLSSKLSWCFQLGPVTKMDKNNIFELKLPGQRDLSKKHSELQLEESYLHASV